ncbi:hypothetical protein I3760_08G125300 [Carya illinoinensis]|nr:hypothetical protein I3760_08G125300 [Carya illinoinensis]
MNQTPLTQICYQLIFCPNEVNFCVTDTSLTDFNFTPNNNTLHYNLALNVSIKNPNKRIGIYNRFKVNAYYIGQRFNTETMMPFYEGHTRIRPLSAQCSNKVFNFDSEKADGVFSITVRLNLRIRPKLSWIKIGHFKPMINCGLKVSLTSNGTSPACMFESTKCSLDL